MSKTHDRRKSDVGEFIALSESQKRRIIRQLEREPSAQRLARSRPLNSRERQEWRRFQSKTGRPRIGKGAKTISLTVERGLLKRADAYAKRRGISRAKLVAQSLRVVLDVAA